MWNWTWGLMGVVGFSMAMMAWDEVEKLRRRVDELERRLGLRPPTEDVPPELQSVRGTRPPEPWSDAS